MAICAKCGAEQPPRFRFCGACGAPLPAEPEREVRKVVTVLFCDLAESTALGERVDPELVRRVLRRYFEEIEGLIVAHGGAVEKFVGDAVMAIFGLPAAHEDDAVRALRVAVELRRRLPALAEETGFPLAFRIGINSGEVVTGSGQTLVTGDAVNVAARLEQAAEPGEVLVGAETVRLAGPSVEADLVPPLQLRGKAEPVEAYRLRGVAEEIGRERPRLVDRERELELMHDAFRRAVQERELHLVTLLGPAGIGKSALAGAFVDAVGAQAQHASGRCLSYGQALGYWPLVELLRALGEPAADALAAVVEGGATSPQQLAWSVQRALEQAAQGRPLLVVLEDLHWAEPVLLDLVDEIADLSRDAPILLLCLARPELLEKRPSWGGGKLNATSLLLEPLPRAECESLLRALDRPLAPEQRDGLVELAAGNPLFLEELSSYVAEGGAEDELPPRIQALLQARLDLLPEPERLLLGCAALEGTTFHLGALDALAPGEVRSELERRVTALTRKELVRPARAELEGERAFRFRHQLIRDTAYGGLTKQRRAELHARFADWLAQHRGERAELDELAAYHLEQAALTRRELGEAEPALEQRAAEALATAAERARLRTDLRSAAALWRRGLELLADDDARVPRLEVELALVLAPLGEPGEAGQLLADAESRTHDPSLAATVRLARLQAKVHYDPEGTPAAIRSECAQAIPLFEQRGDHRALARAWSALADAQTVELRMEAAGESYLHAAEHARLAGDRALEAGALAFRIGFLAATRVPLTAAVEELERLVERFPGEPANECTLLLYRARAAYAENRPEEGRRLGHEAVAGARRAGFTLFAGVWTAAYGHAELLGGDVEEAERLTLAGMAELEQHHERSHLSWVKTLLAQIRIAQGRFHEALELADEGETIGGPHDRGTVIAAGCARARAYAGLGEIDEARAAAALAVSVAGETDSTADQASAQHALAETLAAAGEHPAARAAAEESMRLWTILELDGEARRVAALAARIERATATVAASPPTEHMF